MKMVFRLDANNKIGIGHLMRCFALSQELIRRGNECIFYSKISNDELISKIEEQNVLVKRISEDVSIKQDLKDLISYCRYNDVDWVFTDHYGLNEDYIKSIKQNGLNVFSIDDTVQMYYYSDIVLNQNVDALDLIYSAEDNTDFLLGPDYVLLRDELLIRGKKIFNDEVKNVLISFGGADKDNLTYKVLKVLHEKFKDLRFNVVIGPMNNYYEDFSDFSNRNENIDIFRSPENIEEIYLNSDIAVGAGGSSCYEHAYFGIPGVILSTAKNQVNLSRELDNRGVSIYLGSKEDFNKHRLVNTFSKVLNDSDMRLDMRDNGLNLIDGLGKVRVVDFLERYV